MANLKAQFRGLNTERYGDGLPSGTCISTLNTIVEGNTKVKGRPSFDLWDDDVTTLGNILNMYVASFHNGTIYLITKRINTTPSPDVGILYQRQVYPSLAAGWTVIADNWSGHHVSEPGFFYMWADRVYYFDQVGGTKWHPDKLAVSWKAGMQNNTGPTIDAVGGGGKDGWYHVTTTLRNEKTGAESSCSGWQSGGAVNTRLTAADGGIGITNWYNNDTPETGIVLNDFNQDYEYTTIGVYCTLGNTERAGSGNGVEQFSYQAYLEFNPPTSVLGDGSGDWNSLYRTDAIMQTRPRLTNQGGVPPGASYGCWTGTRAVYFSVYPSAARSQLRYYYVAGNLADGIAMYSKKGFPTMVPQKEIYDIAGAVLDDNIFIPLGGSNELATGIAGAITGCGSLGSRAFAFTQQETYAMAADGHGRMQISPADLTHGAVGYIPVVETPRSLHALGNESWLRIGGRGTSNTANQQFTPTLELIPSGGKAATTGGYYAHRDEVWFAVAQAGETKARRILIYNDQQQELVAIFEPANLGTAGIKAMCQLATPSQPPIMLVALDDGKILKYPGTAFEDAITGDTTAYACHWQGLFGQESRAYDQSLNRVAVGMENNANDITLQAAGLRTSSQAASATHGSKTIDQANDMDESGIDFDPYRSGHLYSLKFSSTTVQGADWEVGDLVLEIVKD